ncbi:hypothetical protein EYF80_033271 [Liparis tanakae]|uniref:Uncharacterized protein n=1 Tax=Liparis tanakae TaxID=230148 RepID=A0A4Z2GTT6_9TELE|nr:hypothetical protein EYF80_033271 [Liparis tanakae]
MVNDAYRCAAIGFEDASSQRTRHPGGCLSAVSTLHKQGIASSRRVRRDDVIGDSCMRRSQGSRLSGSRGAAGCQRSPSPESLA